MAKFTEVLQKLVRPYYNYIIVIMSLIIFTSFGMLAYHRYYKSKTKTESDVANASRRRKDLYVYMFHVDWCPHCKNAMPEWNTFKKSYDKKDKNGYRIHCVDINCTKETSDVTNYLNTYNIESYPTIKMVKDNKTIEFDSPIKSQYLEHFVDTMTA
jgi:thiol-disulfide isomerase/thioredoxin